MRNDRIVTKFKIKADEKVTVSLDTITKTLTEAHVAMAKSQTEAQVAIQHARAVTMRSAAILSLPFLASGLAV